MPVKRRIRGAGKKRTKKNKPKRKNKPKNKAAGGYVPGKLLMKLTIGRMISALKKHWRK